MRDEYIEKERVIEEINNLLDNISDSNYELWKDGYACGLSDAYSSISNIKSPWISTKDRLPESHDTVLICTDSGHVVTSFYDAFYKVFRLTEDEILSYAQGTVTYWMYVPKAPEVNIDGKF